MINGMLFCGSITIVFFVGFVVGIKAAVWVFKRNPQKYKDMIFEDILKQTAPD